MPRTAPPSLAPLLAAAAETHRLPLDLLTAQVEVESSFDAYAFRYEHAFFANYIRSNPSAMGYPYGPLAACSYGLLQLVFETALELGYDAEPEDLFVPVVNLEWGGRLMADLWRRAGGTSRDYPRALAAYNGGSALLVQGVTVPTGPATYARNVYSKAGRAGELPL